MNFSDFVKQTILDIKQKRQQFEGAKDPRQKRAIFDEYMDKITLLHKASKTIQVSSEKVQQLKELIKLFVREAEVMKSAITGRATTISVQNFNQPTAQTHRMTRTQTANKAKSMQNEKLNLEIQGTIVGEKPNVSWDDITGLDYAKETLKETIVLPIKFPNVFEGLRQPWKGILLYGVI